MFRACISDGTISEEDLKYIQNCQDTMHNRYKKPQHRDFLYCHTEKYERRAGKEADIKENMETDDEDLGDQDKVLGPVSWRQYVTRAPLHLKKLDHPPPFHNKNQDRETPAGEKPDSRD